MNDWELKACLNLESESMVGSCVGSTVQNDVDLVNVIWLIDDRHNWMAWSTRFG
jgi:hypothetical protein